MLPGTSLSLEGARRAAPGDAPRAARPAPSEPSERPVPSERAALSTLAAYRPRTSSVRSARHRPGRSAVSVTWPTRVRTSLRTGWPTASSMRRTWRLRPSWITMRNTFGATCPTTAGAVRPSSRSTPSRNRRSSPGPGVPSTSARYSLATPWEGWASRWASSPSFVRMMSPSVS